MEKVCVNPNCSNTITHEATSSEIPILMSEIKDGAIENILNGGIEHFHIHQYGSMVIFLEYLDGLEIEEPIINEYNTQGHVFLLPMKAIDLADLRVGKLQQLVYKAVENESSEPWYKIVVKKNSKSISSKIRNMFKK